MQLLELWLSHDRAKPHAMNADEPALDMIENNGSDSLGFLVGEGEGVTQVPRQRKSG